MVSVVVDTVVAAAARAAGGIVLRDEELTPLAWLDLDSTSIADADAAASASACDQGTEHAAGGTPLRGRLTRMRVRESGPGGRQRLTDADLWSDQSRTVVVFGRPPLTADAAALRAALTHPVDPDQATPPVLALVTDDPASSVPTAVLADSARTWLREQGVHDIEVSSAPLGWRDPTSNATLVTRLAQALGDPRPLFLDPDDGSAESAEWHRVAAALDAGEPAGTTLGSASPAVAARLLRWRRPRATRGLVVMFSGLSGSGKSTLARDVSQWISEFSERSVSLLDGDVVRTMLSSGLGFSKDDRELNVRRIGYVGAEIARHGGTALCAPIAPYASTRDAVREMIATVGDFVLVHVNTPLEECERRDLKGLYAKARAGSIPEFTGISDPYEEPVDADLRVDTSVLDRAAALESVVRLLESGGWVVPAATHATATAASNTTRPSSDAKRENEL